MRISTLIFAICSTLLFYSCETENSNNIYDSEKFEVINTVYCYVIGEPFYPDIPPMRTPLPDEIFNQEDSLIYQETLIEYYQRKTEFESKIHLLSVYDTLFVLSKFTDQNKLNQNIAKDYLSLDIISSNEDTNATIFDVYNIKDTCGWKIHKMGDAFELNDFESSSKIQFSKINFSNDRKLAGIFVRYYCGMSCGTGGYFILQKDSGIWSIVDMYCLYVV